MGTVLLNAPMKSCRRSPSHTMLPLRVVSVTRPGCVVTVRRFLYERMYVYVRRTCHDHSFKKPEQVRVVHAPEKM